jgi:hypothetical protein
MLKIIVAIATPRFSLGQVVITANAYHKLNPPDVHEGIRRHAGGDWGDVDPEDAQLNEDALKYGDRLHSIYGAGECRFWIITESDRSVTTILMPVDY